MRAWFAIVFQVTKAITGPNYNTEILSCNFSVRILEISINVKNVKLRISCQILMSSDKEICFKKPAKGVLFEKLQNCIGLVVTRKAAGLVRFPTRRSSPGRPCEIHSCHAGQ